MKKAIHILLSICLLTACSRSSYYVYDEDGSREAYPAGYCTFEVKGNRWDVVYRGYSEIYANPDATPYAPEYICIDGYSEGLIDERKPILLIGSMMYTKYIYVDDVPDIGSNGDRSISIITPAYNPNIFENNGYIRYVASNKKDSLLVDENLGLKFGSYGSITWFPPYVKRVKKLDYKQFKRNGDLKINYKEPLKTKKKQ